MIGRIAVLDVECGWVLVASLASLTAHDLTWLGCEYTTYESFSLSSLTLITSHSQDMHEDEGNGSRNDCRTDMMVRYSGSSLYCWCRVYVHCSFPLGLFARVDLLFGKASSSQPLLHVLVHCAVEKGIIVEKHCQTVQRWFDKLFGIPIIESILKIMSWVCERGGPSILLGPADQVRWMPCVHLL
jgi:hypothetical protein